MNGGIEEYLKNLRDLIPARTLSLYVLLIGLVSGFAKTPAEVTATFGWALLLVTGACALLNFLGRLVGEKKGIKDALISTGAFLLLTLTQRFTGPLAALGVDSQAAILVVSILAVLYVFVINMVWPPKKVPAYA